MNAKKELIKSFLDLSGSQSPYNIFSDWVQMCAIAVQNSCCMIHDKIFIDREKTYLAIASKYTEKELVAFARMFVLLGEALEENLTDVLGEVYMEAGMGNKYTGQFFTPFHVSKLCSDLTVNTVIYNKNDLIEIDNDGYRLLEPSCGGGGMIIAACKSLLDNGINFQKKLRVVAQDLDWKAVYMAYLQLSLIGCKAIVVQGDTLTEPFDSKKTPPERIMRTPAWMGALL